MEGPDILTAGYQKSLDRYSFKIAYRIMALLYITIFCILIDNSCKRYLGKLQGVMVIHPLL